MKFMQIFKMPNIFVHHRIIEKYFFVGCKTNVDDDWEVHIVHPDNRYFLFFKVSKDFCEFRMFLCCVDDFFSLCMSSFVSRCIFFLQKQVISSLDMSSSLSTRVIYVVLRNDDLLSCCIRLRAAVSHEKCVTYCFYLHSLPIATLALILLWQYWDTFLS